MGKKKELKKLQKAYRKAMEDNLAQRGWQGAAERDDVGGAGGYGNTPLDAGLLRGLGLPSGFGSPQTQQFIIGALIGAAATYVLSDEALRGKLIKLAMNLYGGVAGGFEEFKEQMADLKAEMEAGRGDQA
ncbi:YtxH domain-containing protein [Chitiniphilus eburneus]|uniref:YtxH domain-containing protein n=1 Tax=Chitiniphilus eburneus TaxID=2571148 RepID=A0A4U0QDF8_9NEIS|nr:YtxH domain-containing protein [Chitiniphilus eburneus]TJZ79180.1 YtxH domain-containing protein [Chitiniphilus eburneus]